MEWPSNSTAMERFGGQQNFHLSCFLVLGSPTWDWRKLRPMGCSLVPASILGATVSRGSWLESFRIRTAAEPQLEGNLVLPVCGLRCFLPFFSCLITQQDKFSGNGVAFIQSFSSSAPNVIG